MSMNATDAGTSASAILRATVDFPEPDPPAMPMIVGFIARRGDVIGTQESSRFGDEKEKRERCHGCVSCEAVGRRGVNAEWVVGHWWLVVREEPTTNDQ